MTAAAEPIKLTAPHAQERVAIVPVELNELDWETAGALTFVVSNRGEHPFSLIVDLHVAQLHSRMLVKPGELIRYQIQLPAELKALSGLRRGPRRSNTSTPSVSVHPHKVDRVHQASIVVKLQKEIGLRTLEIRDVQLEPPLSLAGIIDQFGQYSGGDWPGKAHSMEDLRVPQEIDAPLSSGGRDRFGGHVLPKPLEATGRFRTAKVDGRHWLVTPDGNLFFSLGVNAIGRSTASGVEGREDWFQWLPEDRADARKGVNFHLLNLERKYGKDFMTTWLKITPERLLSWGFNTIGNWSDEELWKSGKMAYTVRLLPTADFQRYRAGFAPKHGVPDPFDPAFLQALESEVLAAVAKVNEDPFCLGYFVHNELDWGLWNDEKGRTALARDVLRAPGTAARKAFRQAMEKDHRSIDQLSQVWSFTIGSWDELENRVFDFPEELSPGVESALKKLTRIIASEYFRVVAEAVEQHDPGRLFLGTRFGERWCTPEVLEEAARHSDLLCFNDYRAVIDLENSLWQFVRELDMPAMITEYHFGATDRGMFNGGMQWAENQDDRAASYQRHLQSAAATSFIVGCHWFEYVDQPLTGRGGDGENFGIGLISVVDKPYPELTRAMRISNAEIYDLVLNTASHPSAAE